VPFDKIAYILSEKYIHILALEMASPAQETSTVPIVSAHLRSYPERETQAGRPSDGWALRTFSAGLPVFILVVLY